jgi:hypothetical protein
MYMDSVAPFCGFILFVALLFKDKLLPFCPGFCADRCKAYIVTLSYTLISRAMRYRVMMACQNPRTGTKIEKRTRTGIVAGTVTETEGETGIEIGTRTGIETETKIGIAKVGITVKKGNRETVRMITEAVILNGMSVVFATLPLWFLWMYQKLSDILDISH